MTMDAIRKIYAELLECYGPQGWWPLLDHKGANPTKSGYIDGYHPGDYSFPKTDAQKFEICLGAILTQNTSWTAVEKALTNLKRSNGLGIDGINMLSDGKLKECIKPAGHYNQKAKYIREFTIFFMGLRGRTPSREELLHVRGIGPETADSILLYAFSVPSFVVDAYTRRILTSLGLAGKKAAYDEIKQLFEDSLERDHRIYQEYHALLVEHAKRCYVKKDSHSSCPLKVLMKKL